MERRVQPYQQRYIERLGIRGLRLSPSISGALGRVPLHKFIDRFYLPNNSGVFRAFPYSPKSPDHKALEIIYSGEPIATDVRDGVPTQMTMPALVMAQMLESLELEEHMSMFEVGTGTGFMAALLAEIIGTPSNISTVDIIAENVNRARLSLAGLGYEEIVVNVMDGFYGSASRTPFDRILVTVGCPDLSPHWLEELRPGGFMIVPLDHGGWFPLLRVWKQDRRVRGRVIGSAGMAINRIEGELQGHGFGRILVRELDSAVQKLPLWPSLGLHLENSMASYSRSMKSPLRDFWFYIAARSSEACLVNVVDSKKGLLLARGLGLCEPDNRWGIIVSSKYLLFGHNEVLLKLEGLYREWKELGMPAMTDYEMEFLPHNDVQSVRSSAWTLDRKLFTRQFLWLNQSADF